MECRHNRYLHHQVLPAWQSFVTLHTPTCLPQIAMRNPNRETTFHFNRFDVSNCRSAMKVGTDGVLLGAWAFNNRMKCDDKIAILDVGAGTGLVALMLAQRFPAAAIYGVEIDSDAADECAANFRNSPWCERLYIFNEDFTTFAGNRDNAAKFNLIVSNPPFFTNGAVSPDASRCKARHENSLNIETLMSNSARMLTENGELAVILPVKELERAEFHATLAGFMIARVCEVSTVQHKMPRRVMLQFIKNTIINATQKKEVDKLFMHDSQGNPTAEYISLVEDFYIKIH